MAIMKQDDPGDPLGTVARPDWWRRSGAFRERRRLTDSTPLSPMERRDHRRHTAHVIMEIRGHVEASQVTEIRGVTVDMSCGGVLAVFSEQVEASPDSSFMVRFVDGSGDLIAPEFRWGTVLRADRLRSECVVAVKFEQPLPPAVLVKLLGSHLAPAELAYG